MDSTITPISECICTDSIDNCITSNSLHGFYLSGSIGTIIGTLIVVISYIITPQLRYHPSVIIFYRSIIDFGLGFCLIFLYFVKPYDLLCNEDICNNIGHVTLFLFLCSIGYLTTLLYDLRIAITNPFSSPYDRSITKTNFIIIIMSGSISSIARRTNTFSYRDDVQYCAIKTNSDNDQDFDVHYVMFVFIPLILAVLFSLYVTFTACCRLHKGLPNTFNIRKKAIRAAWTYSILYTLHTLILGILYFMTLIQKIDDVSLHNIDNKEAVNDIYESFAFLFSSFGITDCIVFIIVNYSEIKTCHIKMGISIVRDKDIKTINEALMLEVLAYTTDGIAQSIDRVNNAKSSDASNNYAHHMNKFMVSIKHNWGVTLRKEKKKSNSTTTTIPIQINACCCIIRSKPISLRDHELINVESFHHQKSESVYIYDDSYNENAKSSECAQFTDYAPYIFKYIRNHIIGINDKEYKKSIIPSGHKQQLKVLQETKSGQGKSGAFFYITHDGKYVVKTIRKHEVYKFISILSDYKKHLNKYKQTTILCKFVGLHSIKIYGVTQYFVVMQNVFIPQRRPNEVYDLKGSWIRRITNHRIDDGVTMLDLDFKKNVILNDKYRHNVIKQLQIDSIFLSKHNIIDYSLLLGIYYVKIECQQYGVGQDLLMNNNKKNNNFEDSEIIELVTFNNNDQINEYRNNYGEYQEEEKKEEEEEKKSERNNDIELGVMRASIIEGPGIYSFGIIDILQDYDWKKKLETWWKTSIKRDDKNGLSCIEPIKYHNRFIKYMHDKIISDTEYKKKLTKKNEFPIQKVLIYQSAQFDTAQFNV